MTTATDRHWDERARKVTDEANVNTTDVWQRELEYEYVCRFLSREMRIAEVGCGNGFSTARLREHVRHVDAFDRSEAMVERARAAFGERNNRFLRDDLLGPRELEPPYDAVVCVRVLINLRELEQQRAAIGVLASLLEPGGRLVLVEGFADGFEELSRLRTQVELEPVTPSSVNCYSRIAEFEPELYDRFELEDDFHLGAYDYLTRVVYPLFVAPEPPRQDTSFSEKAYLLARAFNPDVFRPLSRVQGYVLRRR